MSSSSAPSGSESKRPPLRIGGRGSTCVRRPDPRDPPSRRRYLPEVGSGRSRVAGPNFDYLEILSQLRPRTRARPRSGGDALVLALRRTKRARSRDDCIVWCDASSTSSRFTAQNGRGAGATSSRGGVVPAGTPSTRGRALRRPAWAHRLASWCAGVEMARPCRRSSRGACDRVPVDSARTLAAPLADTGLTPVYASRCPSSVGVRYRHRFRRSFAQRRAGVRHYRSQRHVPFRTDARLFCVHQQAKRRWCRHTGKIVRRLRRFLQRTGNGKFRRNRHGKRQEPPMFLLGGTPR